MEKRYNIGKGEGFLAVPSPPNTAKLNYVAERSFRIGLSCSL